MPRRRRAQGITDPTARQNLVIELYDTFFRGAFPRITAMLGIVYCRSDRGLHHPWNDVLRAEFEQTLGSKGVHILDPFAGTGTFITRLLSGLIAPEDLERKYREEIHDRSARLLVAAICVETVFHAVAGRDDYLLTRTSASLLHEGEDELSFS